MKKAHITTSAIIVLVAMLSGVKAHDVAAYHKPAPVVHVAPVVIAKPTPPPAPAIAPKPVATKPAAVPVRSVR